MERINVYNIPEVAYIENTLKRREGRKKNNIWNSKYKQSKNLQVTKWNFTDSTKSSSILQFTIY